MPNSGPSTIGYSPASDITLTWETWSEAAHQASESRLLGGIHVRQSNAHGYIVGRAVGLNVYNKAKRLFEGRSQLYCFEGGVVEQLVPRPGDPFTIEPINYIEPETTCPRTSPTPSSSGAESSFAGMSTLVLVIMSIIMATLM